LILVFEEISPEKRLPDSGSFMSRNSTRKRDESQQVISQGEVVGWEGGFF